MFKKTALLAAGLGLTLAAGSASAISIALQSEYGILDLNANGGINPNTGAAWKAGDQYRLAFHTVGTIKAQSNDPGVYDGFATAQANSSGLGNGAITTSTGWTAMVWVNLDGTKDQLIQTGTNPNNGNPIFGLNPDMPLSSPLVRSGTDNLTDGAGQGGAGVPVYAMDGTTAIARNNADIYNSWSNPFESSFGVVDPTGNGNNTQRIFYENGNGNNDPHYSPFLDQNGNQTVNVDTIHGKANWTGGFGSPVNPLGDSTNEVRASYGNSNANRTGRVYNRFQNGQHRLAWRLRDLPAADGQRSPRAFIPRPAGPGRPARRPPPAWLIDPGLNFSIKSHPGQSWPGCFFVSAGPFILLFLRTLFLENLSSGEL